MRMRVLLVEDDALIRLSTSDMLRELGHSVLEATNAAEALDLLDGEEVDILITDIGLPGLSGDVLAAQASARRPGLRVIFASGYDIPLQAAVQHGMPVPIILRKPFDDKGLKAAVEAAMIKPAGIARPPDAQGSTGA